MEQDNTFLCKSLISEGANAQTAKMVDVIYIELHISLNTARGPEVSIT